MSESDPSWALEGVENFRDFGGYAAGDGRRVRKGRLFRSAHHAQATLADLELIHALGIKTWVDLRRRTERGRMPNLRKEAFIGEVLDNDLGDLPVDTFHTLLIESDQSVDAMKTYLRDYYRKVAFEPRHLDLYRRYFLSLADTGGPVLIHCAAGKDRTGLLAALTLRLLGVDEADIVSDYLLTNDPVRMQRRAPGFAAWVEDLTGRRPSEEAIFASMGVEAEYLQIAINAIEARYETVDYYMNAALGVDDALKARIQANLLV